MHSDPVARVAHARVSSTWRTRSESGAAIWYFVDLACGTPLSKSLAWMLSNNIKPAPAMVDKREK